ncbi:hypothetical protein [Legionella bozemanae]|uniref:Uncharacterized protein n=1 Tax=Legionella bozemanae TaxID=447 RepID=A0A0W0RJ94_LEGBO|nr:hypothetical protein [Legionella bozemanae]KTC71127.1 hypothetical protein Lboz_2704 [Legionella bozemanae]STO33262.1 Uncharacterised protein [Legionella bozemanae]
MGFNFFKKYYDKANTALDEIATNNPRIYNTVRKLIDELANVERLAKNREEPLHPDILNAVQQLKAQLNETKRQFDNDFKEGIPLLQFQRRVRDFANDCRSAIYSYEPTLMAAPGILNKLKAYINAFLEQYFAVESYFNTEKNALGLKTEFSKNYNNRKRELTQEVFRSDGSEDTCGLGLF